MKKDQLKKLEGYNFRLTYNDTNDFLVFKDIYFKTENGAIRRMKKLNDLNIAMVKIVIL